MGATPSRERCLETSAVRMSPRVFRDCLYQSICRPRDVVVGRALDLLEEGHVSLFDRLNPVGRQILGSIEDLGYRPNDAGDGIAVSAEVGALTMHSSQAC